MNMKMSRVCLVLGFVVIIMALHSDALPDSVTHPEPCCFSFFNGKIPPQNILEVKKTDTQCPQQGFIVKTPRHASLCVHEVTVPEQPKP